VKLTFGVVLALASSGLFAVGYIGQHRATNRLERLEIRHPAATMRRLLADRSWFIAYGASLAGWGAYVAAVSLAPLSIVQAVSGGTIGLLALGSRTTAPTVTRATRAAAVVATVGLVLVLSSAHSARNFHHPAIGDVLVLVGVALVIGVLVISVVPVQFHGVALGVASGLAYGVGDVATKAAVGGDPLLVPVFLCCALAGFTLLQLSYQQTTLLGSAGLSSLFTNSIPIVSGIVLFGEAPASGAQTWLRAVGFAAVVVGAIGLARDPSPAG
jgi:hypothetical protein